MCTWPGVVLCESAGFVPLQFCASFDVPVGCEVAPLQKVKRLEQIECLVEGEVFLGGERLLHRLANRRVVFILCLGCFVL